MRYAIAVIILTILPATLSAQANVSGKLACKVTSMFVVGVEDGKPTVHTHYTDGFKLGDELSLNFIFKQHQTPRPDWLKVELYDDIRDEGIITYAMFIDDEDKFEEFEGGYSLDNQKRRLPGELGIWPNNLSISGVNWIPYAKRSLKMSRYYKSDWQGIGVESQGNTVQTYTLNCQTFGKTMIDDLIQEIPSKVE